MLDDSHKRKSLGRGLGALLGGDMDFMTSENAVHAAGEKNLSLADLSPSPYQPRLDFDREALEALSQSVREKAYCSRCWCANGKTENTKLSPVNGVFALPPWPV